MGRIARVLIGLCIVAFSGCTFCWNPLFDDGVDDDPFFDFEDDDDFFDDDDDECSTGACEVFGLNARGTCCNADDVCVPLGSDFDGICRRRCGELEVENGFAVGADIDDDVDCPDINGREASCQVATSLPWGEIVAVACLPLATERDAQCGSYVDDVLGFASCPAGQDCRVAAVVEGTAGTEFTSLNCKEPCDPSAPACSVPEEQCLPDPVNQPLAVDVDGAGALISCAVKLSEPAEPMPECVDGGALRDDAVCPCDLAGGSPCAQVFRAGGAADFICVQQQRFACALEIPQVTAAAADPLTDPALSCNEVDASRYCSNDMFAGAPAPAGKALCVGTSFTTNDGICFAWCGDPGADLDGDGVVGDDEQPVRLACGAGYTCSPAFALRFMVAFPLVDAGGAALSCDPVECPAAEPCAACGPGDAYCRANDVDGAAGSCLAPFLQCEPDEA